MKKERKNMGTSQKEIRQGYLINIVNNVGYTSSSSEMMQIIHK